MFFLQVSCEWVVPINTRPILGIRYRNFVFRLQKYQFFVINANVLGKNFSLTINRQKCLYDNFVNDFVKKIGRNSSSKKELL